MKENKPKTTLTKELIQRGLISVKDEKSYYKVQSRMRQLSKELKAKKLSTKKEVVLVDKKKKKG